MTRDERRRRAEIKMNQRKKLAGQLGLQGGTIYERHRNKLDKSYGYMRKGGNVTHYIAAGFAEKTTDRNRYGAVTRLTVKDKKAVENYLQQLEEYKKSKDNEDSR